MQFLPWNICAGIVDGIGGEHENKHADKQDGDNGADNAKKNCK